MGGLTFMRRAPDAKTYTSGPWRLDQGKFAAAVVDETYHTISGGKGFYGLSGNGFSLSGIISIYDARLVAAAPDLLDALSAILALKGETEMSHQEAYDAMFKQVEPWASARAAIARATGAP